MIDEKKFTISIYLLSEILRFPHEEVIKFLKDNHINVIDEDYVDIRAVNKIIKNKRSIYNFSKVNLGSRISSENTQKLSNLRLRAIDLFSGAGGFSKGFSMAGIDVVGAVEINKVAAATHHINFPESVTVCEDIQTFTPERMEEKVGKNIDIIFGSPPCQTFSSLSGGKIASLGREVEDDIRNYYYKSFIDYVQHFQPKVFLMENVPGFASKYEGKIYNDLMTYFEENTDYNVISTYLQSEQFEVPQKRKRLFILGYKNEFSVSFPKSQGECTTVEDAIQDLPAITDDWRLDEMPYSKYHSLTDYQINMRTSSNMVKNNICRLSNESAKEMFQFLEPGQRYLEIDEINREKLPFIKAFKSKIIQSRCRRLPLNAPSWTIIAHIGMDGYEYIHPTENRTLSVREAARLQSFPDDFVFIGNMREQYVQVGNAVPPLLAKAIAEEIKLVLLSKANQKEEVIY